MMMVTGQLYNSPPVVCYFVPALLRVVRALDTAFVPFAAPFAPPDDAALESFPADAADAAAPFRAAFGAAFEEAAAPLPLLAAALVPSPPSSPSGASFLFLLLLLLPPPFSGDGPGSADAFPLLPVFPFLLPPPAFTLAALPDADAPALPGAGAAFDDFPGAPFGVVAAAPFDDFRGAPFDDVGASP